MKRKSLINKLNYGSSMTCGCFFTFCLHELLKPTVHAGNGLPECKRAISTQGHESSKLSLRSTVRWSWNKHLFFKHSPQRCCPRFYILYLTKMIIRQCCYVQCSWVNANLCCFFFRFTRDKKSSIMAADLNKDIFLIFAYGPLGIQ